MPDGARRTDAAADPVLAGGGIDGLRRARRARARAVKTGGGATIDSPCPVESAGAQRSIHPEPRNRRRPSGYGKGIQSSSGDGGGGPDELRRPHGAPCGPEHAQASIGSRPTADRHGWRRVRPRAPSACASRCLGRDRALSVSARAGRPRIRSRAAVRNPLRALDGGHRRPRHRPRQPCSALAEPGSDPVHVAAPGRCPDRSARRHAEPRRLRSRSRPRAARYPDARLTCAGSSRQLFVLMARRAAGGPRSAGRPSRSADRLTRPDPHEVRRCRDPGSDVRRPRRRGPALGFVTRDAPYRLDGWLCAPLGHPPEAQARPASSTG